MVTESADPQTDRLGFRLRRRETGVAVAMTESDGLELSPAAKGAGGCELVRDAALGGDMVLFRQGGRLLAARGERLYRLAMK